jgi:hypothetical protein
MRVVTQRACGVCRRCVRPVVVVDELFEFFAGFEIRNSLGRDAHGIARFGISTASRATLADAKTAETAQLDLLALIQRFNDAFKNDFY